MAVPVLLTKVILPHRSSDLLTRQRLVEEVEESLDRKLILVVAPAGYGKTSLLIDVAHRHEFPFCWYSQERTDNDLSSFLTHLIACIEQRFSGFGEQSRAALIALDQGNLTPEQCETVIVNELYDSITEHFVIVLDDYQMVSDNAEINHFVNRFVQDVDQNCHIVILSRKLLSLADLPLMVARSQASGIGVRELAFLPDEIKSLMLQNYHQVVSDAAAQELAQQTEGWITGLLLSAQTMRGRKPDQLQYTSSAQLYDYLANQVLDQQTPEVRDFLLQTAFMEEFNADLCQEFLGPPPAKYTWKKMMEMVVRQNLFVLLVEKEGFWLRYHQLFSDFLQDRLCQDDPQRAYQLQKSLVNSYSNHQQWQKAYAICLSLGDLDTTADFLERTGELMIRSGRVAMLKNWLEALPASLIAERPGLLARLGIVLATQGDTQRGLSLLNQAARQYIVQQNEKHLARVLAWRALVHYLQARWEDAVADAKEVLKLTQNAADDESLTRSRAEAYRVLGQYSRLQGNFKQSISQLSEAQKLYQSQLDTSGFNVLQMSLGASYGESGDISSAQTSYFQALEYYQSQGDLFSEAAVLNDMAVLQHMKGEYSQAFTTFEQALDTARRGSNIRVETMIYIGMGDLFIDLDVPDTALEAYYHARDRVVQSNDNFLNIYQHIAEASANRLKMDFSRARNLLNTAEQLMGLNPLNYTHALWLLESGQLEFAEEYFVQAREEFAQAARLFESIDQHILAGRAYLLLGGVHFALNNLNEAEIQLEKAFQNISDLESQHVLVCSARQVKQLLASDELSPANRQRARQLLERVKLFEANLIPLRRSLRFQKMEIQLAPATLKIQALGVPLVVLNGRPITSADWQTQTTRELFFLILSRPQGWGKELPGELIWPGNSPARLNNRFKNAIYRMRRAIRQDVILFDGKRYSFNRNLDYSYDVERFEELFAQAKEERDPVRRKQILEELFLLYQGDYLSEINGVWVMPEREHLRQVFLSAGLQLAELYMNDVQPEKAGEICRRLISSDACLEKAYCLAMQALAADNDLPGIIRLYEKLQVNLEKELGTAPSPQAKALFYTLIH